MDVGDSSEGCCLLGVVEHDGILSGHCIHHPVGESEQGLGRQPGLVSVHRGLLLAAARLNSPEFEQLGIEPHSRGVLVLSGEAEDRLGHIDPGVDPGAVRHLVTVIRL